jgi:nucleotide-binding universal stress UspA family protein
VLAVEARRSRSTASTDLVEVGQAVSRVLHSGIPTSNAPGLFGRVLVPVWDVSATHSIACISALTRAAGGELVLLGVVPRACGLLALANMAEALERLAASDAADGTSVRATVLPYPAWPDLEMAASATLVVLPLPALDDTLEPTWYELIEHLVASSRVPLLVIPHASHAATGGFSRCILAAIDGSPASAKVLDATAALAHATNASVVVLQVGTDAPPHLANQHGGAPFGAQPAGARAWADRAARSLRQPAVDAVGRAVLGDAAAAIPVIAEDTNARVIVLGTSAQAGKKRWLGSTTSAVLRQTQRPVLLVRPDGAIARSNPATTPLSEVDRRTLPSPR